jgi:putative membrane protein
MKIYHIITMSACSALLAGTLLTSSFANAATTDDDKQFLSTAAQSDINEIKLSQLAETKASSPQVKAFAKKMVTDHTKLETQMKPFATKWNLTPPAALDSDHQAIYDRLNGLSGADFDKAYMTAMAEDHHKALDAFTAEAQSTQDAQFKAAVLKGKTVVAGHTTMADNLESKSKM